MATKKQKRLEGEKRQARNRLEAVRSGLLAQEKDREARARKKAQQKEALRREQELEKARSEAIVGMKLVASASNGNGEF